MVDVYAAPSPMSIRARNTPVERAEAAPAPRRARGRARRRLSLPLAVIVLVAVIEALAWTIALPPLQGPDEISHIAYVERLAETRSIPWYPGGPPAQPGPRTSTEAAAAARFGGILAESQNPAALAPGSDPEVELWKRQPAREDRSDRADGGYTNAMGNPPLYYLYAAVPYLATYPLDFFDRAFAVRLANLLPLVAVIVFTWGIAGLLMRRRSLQVLCTAAVALSPQFTQAAAVVSPDMLLAAEWTAFFYLGLLTLKRGPTRARTAGILALAVASSLTHGRGIAMLAPAALVLAVAWWRARRPGGALAWSVVAGAAALTLATAYAALRYATLGQLNAVSGREFASYIWQFYLPKLPFMQTTFRPDWTVRDAFVDRFYGTFAQFEVFFSPHVMTLLAWLTAGAVVLAVVGLVSRLRAGRVRGAELWALVLLIAGAVAYLLDAHIAAYRSLASGSSDPVITGRYLLPLISIYGLGTALAVSWLPRRLAGIGGGVVLAGLALLQLASMGILVERFYA